MEIKNNFSLKTYNTFGIDISAKIFVEIFSQKELLNILSDPSFQNFDKLILGGGSNILFTKNYDGLVIKISTNFIEIIEDTKEYALVRIAAGVTWHDLVIFAVENNYGGAAPIQNIGAYGQELKDTFHSLKGIFLDSQEEKIFYKDECKFGYRNSIFKNELKNKFIITEVILKLNKNPELNTSYGAIEDEIKKLNLREVSVKDISNIVSEIRRSKLPDPAVIGNAGSFFKNPEIPLEKFKDLKTSYPTIPGFSIDKTIIKVPAGWLIENAGLKGMKSGNTGTHNKQALVIVNYGEATGAEILKFKDFIKEKIKFKFEIDLEEEVNVI
jgi:UDP-N-acetylmuramate dehydrogenase